MRCVPRDSEHGVEGPVRRLNSQAGVEHNQWIHDGVQDRLRVFPFVNRLVDARAEGRDVREREYRSDDLLIVLYVWCDAKEKVTIADADFAAAWYSVSEHLRAKPVNALVAGKNASRRTADIRWCQPQCRCRGAVAVQYFALVADDDDREVDGV